MLTAKLVHSLDAPWDQLEPLRLGEVPSGLGTPAAYVTACSDEAPILRLDVYPGPGCFFREQAIGWKGLVAVGIGSAAFLVTLGTRAVTTLGLDGYFSEFWSSPEALLVVDAAGIRRVDSDGAMLWSTGNLGIDGVVIREVGHGIIAGDGCWDPPEGWEPFALSLETGHKVVAR